MCKKKNGFLRFLLICGVIAAAAYAIAVLLKKMKEKLEASDDIGDTEEEAGCNGCCDECELCDADDDADEEVEAVEAAPETAAEEEATEETK